jgi:hypothetical protein
MDETKKDIDESWKEAAAKEKDKETAKLEKEPIPPEASFSFFISTLALQASVFSGQIPNPATEKKEKNLKQAKFIIDTLDMLKDKTRNNLNADEDKLLENVLYELKMQYVAAAKSNEDAT